MAAYINKSGGMLILPDNTEIKAGGSADISADVAKVVGVQQWIDAGWLERKAKPTKAEVEAQAKAEAEAKEAEERADLIKQAGELEVETTDEMTIDQIKALIDAKLAE